MKKTNKWMMLYSFSSLIFCIVTLAIIPIQTHASNENDFRVLVDVSGSMKKNDANNMRRPAIELLIRLAPENSLVGIWTFGQNVDMLVPHRRVSKNWRDFSSTQVDKIHSTALRTNIGLALEMAMSESLASSYEDNSDNQKVIVLLTDGVVDVSADSNINDDERIRILEKLLPQMQAAGLIIHTIALSSNADKDLLQQLSLATDGVYTLAEDADQLASVFLSAFDLSFPVNRIPINEEGFLIDKGIDEFTLLMMRGVEPYKLHLKTPSNVLLKKDTEQSNVSWFSSPAYDLITVSEPEAGYWIVNEGLTNQTRVSIVSDVALRLSDVANNIYPRSAMTIDAQLQALNHIIIDQNLIDLIGVDYRLITPNGHVISDTFLLLNKDKAHYQATLNDLSQRGSYELVVTAKADTFQRQQIKRFIVHDSFIADLSVDDESQAVSLDVKIKDPYLIGQQIDLTAAIQVANSVIVERSLSQKNNGSWEFTSTPLNAGDYSLHLQANAEDPLLTLNDFKLANMPFSIIEDRLTTTISDLPLPETETETEAEAEAEAEAETSGDEKVLFSKNMWLFFFLTLANAGLIASLLLLYRRYFSSSVIPSTVDKEDKGLLEVKDQDLAASNVNSDTANYSSPPEDERINRDFDISQQDSSGANSDRTDRNDKS